MSRTISIRAAALLMSVLLLLSGCTLTDAGSTSATEAGDERSKLYAILDDISENLHPGTAGSSLTAIRLTAELIFWAKDTDLTVSETADAAADWLAEHPELADSFREQLSSMADSFQTIIKDGATGLLESAGINSDLSNLGTRLIELVEAILKSGGVNKG